MRMAIPLFPSFAGSCGSGRGGLGCRDQSGLRDLICLTPADSGTACGSPGCRKLQHPLREKAALLPALLSVAPLPHSSATCISRLPSWWLLWGRLAPATHLALLCILHTASSTIRGSLRELINSVHCTSSADHHTGRAISRPGH